MHSATQVILRSLALLTLLAGLALQPLAADDLSPVDINTASVEELTSSLVGVGPARAAAIVAYREANGPFVVVDDLVLVKGIGEATLQRNRGRLRASE